jgi:hypothetical protein
MCDDGMLWLLLASRACALVCAHVCVQVYHSVRRWAPYDVLGQLLQQQQLPQQQQQQQGCLAQLPSVLIRAALCDEDVPLHDSIRATARLQRLQQRLQQQDHSQAGQQRQQQQQQGGLGTLGVLLRVVPGDHGAFEGDVREAALQLAFLLTAVQQRV